MSDFSREFPQYLNRPLQVLWWETDDLIMMMMAFFIALVFGGWTWLLVLVVPITYGRMKKTAQEAFSCTASTSWASSASRAIQAILRGSF